LNLNERTTLFEKELNLFVNTNIRDYAVFCLGKIPEYFFSVPASQSGKYHPSYALGDGGLVRHTKAAMHIFASLITAGIGTYYPNDYGFEADEVNDSCLLALLFHDAFKLGASPALDNESESKHTLHEHPLIAADFIKAQILHFMENHDLNAYDVSIIEEAAKSISMHMGRYTASRRSHIVLPSPASGDWCAKIVHICDLMASRKYLEFNFAEGALES